MYSHVCITPEHLEGVPGVRALAAKHFGIQAQEPTAAFVSLWQRLKGGASEAKSEDEGVEPLTLGKFQKWYQEPSGFVRIWGQRSTLQLFDADDWSSVCASVGPGVIAHREKQVQTGAVTGRDSAAQLAAAREYFAGVLAAGKHVRGSDVATAGYPAKLQYSIFMCATVEGQGARWDVDGVGSESVLAPRNRFFPADDTWSTPSMEEALKLAARRYFGTYGPATEADFRYYMGLTAGPSQTVVRALLSSCEIVIVTVEAGVSSKKKDVFYCATTNLTLLTSPVPPLPEWPARLLFRFDPILLAHVDKGFWIPPEHKGRVWTKNGIIMATVLTEGRITGTWTHMSDKQHLMKIVIRRLPDTPGYSELVKDLLTAQAERFAGFMEKTLEKVDFEEA
ncbi:hypothetical protein HKX48_008424 [Thoreauomyces humboldtii]|nr:hypothetical protein HKX48_008424 [Thoreauomyces humboldtii]